MSSRTILSRPRTRLYDCNYNIGESYYKSALDRIDRKYSGRPVTPPPRQSSLPKDLLERHERAFADEDLNTARQRASKHISESHILDGIGSSRAAERALELMDGDIDEETQTRLRRIRASKKQSVTDDLDLENLVSNISARRIKERADKLLDTVGISEEPSRTLDSTYVLKKKSLKVTYEDTGDSKEQLTKWTALNNKEEDSSAALRARMSRARLEELEDESNALLERQAARERRAAKLRAILAENTEDSAADSSSSMQALRYSARKEKKTVEY